MIIKYLATLLFTSFFITISFAQTPADLAFEPHRNYITDRNGALLAVDMPSWTVSVNLDEIEDLDELLNNLSSILPDFDIREVSDRARSEKGFMHLARGLSPRQKDAIYNTIEGDIHLNDSAKRVYPTGNIASHIVGTTRLSEDSVGRIVAVGASGSEAFFDKNIKYYSDEQVPIVLSIDIALQHNIRSILVKSMDEFGARAAASVLISVDTGELLSSVSLPDFDPNDRVQLFGGDPEFSPYFNRAIQGRYEFGSTFNALTAAMAFDSGVAGQRTVIETPASLRFGRHRIGDAHRVPPEMTIEDIVVRSSNVGSARLSMMVGTRRFKDYLRKLGMFEPIALEVEEASQALPLLPVRWNDLSTMTISFGHGVAVSPIHLAAAYATIANGGRRVYPSMLLGGNQPGEQVFSKSAARDTLSVLRQVVSRGTARRADLPSLPTGGKTGTAEKVRANGGYDRDRVIATFVSTIPALDPQYVLVVVLDEPNYREGDRMHRTAGRTAVPVAAAIIEKISPMLGLQVGPTSLAPLKKALLNERDQHSGTTTYALGDVVRSSGADFPEPTR